MDHDSQVEPDADGHGCVTPETRGHPHGIRVQTQSAFRVIEIGRGTLRLAHGSIHYSISGNN